MRAVGKIKAMTADHEIGGQSRPSLHRRGRLALLAWICVLLLVACTVTPGGQRGADQISGDPGQPLLVVVGDSYSEGVDNTVVWPELLAGDRGYRLANLSSGGTGYVNRGFTSTFVERIRDADVPRPGIIIFAGSRNDIVFSPAQVRTAAKQAFSIARERFPRARLIAVGPIWDSSKPIDAVRAVNRAVADAADASGVEFIDAVSGDFLGDPGVIHVDGIHATDAGQQALSDAIEASITNLP